MMRTAGLVLAGMLAASAAQAAGVGTIVYQKSGDQDDLFAQWSGFARGQYIVEYRADEPVYMNLEFLYTTGYNEYRILPDSTRDYVGGNDQTVWTGFDGVADVVKLQVYVREARTVLSDFGRFETEYFNRSPRLGVYLYPDPGQTFDFTVTLTHVAAPIPEPATWALLIAGFGLTGATFRRRRSQPA